jgi:hypothetical protein
MWLRCGNSALYGIPQLNETESVTLQVTDSLGTTAQANLNLVVGVTGALSIVTPSGQATYYQPTAVVGTLFSQRMLASGGNPPYYWSFTGPAFATIGSVTSTNYALPQSGWLSCAAIAAGADTFNVQVTDNNGTVVTQSVQVTHQSTGITFYPVDLTGTPVVNLPDAFASTSYLYQLKVAGGSGSGRVFSIASGSLPSGLALSSSGAISGAPSFSGSISTCQVKCVDSASNSTTIPLYLNVGSLNKVSRPAYNTGTGFFVDSNGYFRDPNGYLYQFRGMDRAHYNSANWSSTASGALAYPGVARTNYFNLGLTPAGIMANALAQNINNYILPVFMYGYFPDGTGTSGNTSLVEFAACLTDWINAFSSFSAYQNEIVINVANEWGSQTSSDPVWANAYLGVFANISAISGTTITVSTVSATNPFASCQVAYILNAGGITSQVVNLSTPAGSSGAWTVQSSVSLSGYTSGGTLNGGAIGALRSAGYTCPILIDANASGEDPYGLINYGQSLTASDPQKNIVLAHHSYHCPLPYQGTIGSVAQGTTTTLTLSNNTTSHPLAPFGGTTQFANTLYISGALGLTQLNGAQSASGTISGSPGAWIVKLNVDSTAWSGSYTANSATIVLDATTGQNIDYRILYPKFAALRSSGVCVAIMESGPGNQTGSLTSTSTWNDNQWTTPSQVISTAEANGLPWVEWAWDDHNAVITSPAAFANNSFSMTFGNNGVYTAPSNLTAFGLDIVGNPRYGLWALAQPAPYFLPQSSPLSLPTVTAGDNIFAFLGSFKAPSVFTGGIGFRGGMNVSNGTLYMTGEYVNPLNVNQYIPGMGSMLLPTLTPVTPALDGSNWPTPTTFSAPVRPIITPGSSWTPDYPWGQASGDYICGSLVYNGNMYLTGAPFYDSVNNATLGWIVQSNLANTTWGPVNSVSGQPSQAGALPQGSRRYGCCTIGALPAIWQPILGGTAYIASGPGGGPGNVGIDSASLPSGFTFSTFNPANVSSSSGNAVPINPWLDYFYQGALTQIWPESLAGRSMSGPFPLAGPPYPSATTFTLTAIPSIGAQKATLTAVFVDPFPTDSGVTGAHFQVIFSSGETRNVYMSYTSASIPAQSGGGSGDAITFAPLTLTNTSTSVTILPLGDNYVTGYNGALGCALIVPGSRTLLFIGLQCYGPLGPANPTCVPGQSGSTMTAVGADVYPYARIQCTAYDLNEIYENIQSGGNLWDINPYAIWDFPSWSNWRQTSGGYCLTVGSPGWIAIDYANSVMYGIFNANIEGTTTHIINAWSIASL